MKRGPFLKRCLLVLLAGPFALRYIPNVAQVGSRVTTYWDGNLVFVYVWNRVLTAEEASRLYDVSPECRTHVTVYERLTQRELEAARKEYYALGRALDV